VFVFRQYFGGFEWLIGERTLNVVSVGLLLSGSLRVVFVTGCGIVGMGLVELSLLCRGRRGTFGCAFEVGLGECAIRGVWCSHWGRLRCLGKRGPC
jgi:hypothetical protein